VLTRESSDHRAPPTWLRVATELLSDSGAHAPTISEIAAVAGVHRVHLARAFRTFHGCSPATFQRQRRLERAAGLIRHSRRSLSDIALSCGFVDQSHMTTAFRRHHGVTPAEWRRASDTA
jgi:AraC family transcriptional regulator